MNKVSKDAVNECAIQLEACCVRYADALAKHLGTHPLPDNHICSIADATMATLTSLYATPVWGTKHVELVEK
jgi:hypothetical protein